MKNKPQLFTLIWLLVIFVFVSVGQTGKAGKPRTQSWQTSWELFIDRLAMCDKRNTGCNELKGKAVIWEGVVDEVKTVDGKLLVYLRMTPKTFKSQGKTALADVIFPEIAPADVERWQKIPKGTKVRFSASLTDTWIFPTVGGDLAVVVSTKVVKLIKELPQSPNPSQ